jgi:hypothetical protein
LSEGREETVSVCLFCVAALISADCQTRNAELMRRGDLFLPANSIISDCRDIVCEFDARAFCTAPCRVSAEQLEFLVCNVLKIDLRYPQAKIGNVANARSMMRVFSLVA